MTAEGSGFAIGLAAGSIPFAWLLHKAATGRDLRDEGSGNPGATNALRSDGPAWAAAALILDAGKGAAAVAIASLAGGADGCVPAAIGAVVGHAFTPWLKGRGGKGVATAAGAYAVIAPAATALALAVFVLVLAVTRYVSFASVIGAAALPCALGLVGPRGRALLAAAAIGLFIAWRHRANFARMREGTEPRLTRRAADRGSASR